MKIKTKLAISFCIIIFVPVVLTSIVLVGFNKIQLKAINKTYGMEDAGMLGLSLGHMQEIIFLSHSLDFHRYHGRLTESVD